MRNTKTRVANPGNQGGIVNKGSPANGVSTAAAVKKAVVNKAGDKAKVSGKTN